MPTNKLPSAFERGDLFSRKGDKVSSTKTIMVDNLTYDATMIRRLESALAKSYERDEAIRKLVLPLISVKEPEPPDTLTAITRYLDERGELAVRMVESMGFQGAADIRNLRQDLLETQRRVMELGQEKQMALMEFSHDILVVLSEFGYATPEQPPSSPEDILTALRVAFIKAQTLETT